MTVFGMKKILLWLIAALALTVFADFAIGFLMEKRISAGPLPGDYESVEHVLMHSDEELMVLGSSVALNSINTATLSDSLGITAFNGGANGQTFPFYLTMLKAMLESNPNVKTVLLGMIENNLSDTGTGKRYNVLAPYYGHDIADIDANMEGSEPLGGIFLKSNTYRLNNIWFRILLYHFMSAGIKGDNGFVAKDIPSIYPSLQVYDSEAKPISDERLGQFDDFTRSCRDKRVRLIVFLPPVYSRGVQHPVVETLRQKSHADGFELWDDSMLQPFASDSTLFYDNNHLNINGAHIYTDTIIKRLRNIIIK